LNKLSALGFYRYVAIISKLISGALVLLPSSWQLVLHHTTNTHQWRYLSQLFFVFGFIFISPKVYLCKGYW